MFYAQYRGKSTGRILHYIHAYCGLHYAERVVFDGKQITYNGKPFATVRWKKYGKYVSIPFFIFKIEDKAKHLLFDNIQTEKLKEVAFDDVQRESDDLIRRTIDLMEKFGEPGLDSWAILEIKESIKKFISEVTNEDD